MSENLIILIFLQDKAICLHTKYKSNLHIYEGRIPITQSLNVAANILDANSMTATLLKKNSSAALNKD